MRTRREIVVVDRVLLTLLGIAMVAGGVLLVAAAAGMTGPLASPDGSVELADARGAVDAAWWTSACAVAAVVSAALGMWWLVAHGPGKRTRRLSLSGSTDDARLLVAPDAVVRTASTALESDPRVRSARLVLRRERGRLVVVGKVRTSSGTDVVEVANLVDETARSVAVVLGYDVAGRVRIAVSQRP